MNGHKYHSHGVEDNTLSTIKWTHSHPKKNLQKMMKRYSQQQLRLIRNVNPQTSNVLKICHATNLFLESITASYRPTPTTSPHSPVQTKGGYYPNQEILHLASEYPLGTVYVEAQLRTHATCPTKEPQDVEMAVYLASRLNLDCAVAAVCYMRRTLRSALTTHHTYPPRDPRYL